MNHKQKLDQLQQTLSKQEFKTTGELNLAHFMGLLIVSMKEIVADMEAVTATAKTAEAVEADTRKTITMTREHDGYALVLRFTPCKEGYLSEASMDGGATFTPPEGRTQEQADGVVSYCRSRSDTVVEESAFIAPSKAELFQYDELWASFYIVKDDEHQTINVEELDYSAPMWKQNSKDNAIALLVEIKLACEVGDIVYKGKNYFLYWSEQVLAELALCATRAES